MPRLHRLAFLPSLMETEEHDSVCASPIGTAFWLAAGDNVIAELAKLHLRGRASPQLLNPW